MVRSQVGGRAPTGSPLHGLIDPGQLRGGPRRSGAVGREVLVDGVPTVIVGIVQTQSGFPQMTDMWQPIGQMRGFVRDSRTARSLRVVSRVPDGIQVTAARAEIEVAGLRMAAAYPDTNGDVRLHVQRINERYLGDYRNPGWMSFMAVGCLVALISFANVANLLIGRALDRGREVALRVSLGAGRVRLVRQVLTESILLSALGGLIGVALASAGAATLARIMLSGREFLRMPRIEIQTQPDLQVLVFTATVAMLTALLFGAAPAWYALTSAPASSLRATGAAGETRKRRLFGTSLVVAQVALSVLLLSAAVVFVQHLSRLRNQDFGFARSSLLLVTLDPSTSGYRSEQLFSPYQNLLGRLEGLPGVRSVTLSGVIPISGAGASRFVEVEGFLEAAEARRYIPLNWVGPRYFETFGTPLLAGREFAFADRSGPPVAIVNQTMARYYFGDRNPIGGRFRFVGPSNSGGTGPSQAYEIVGVVGDAKYLDLREIPPRTIYLNAFQEPRMFASRFALRTTGRPGVVAGEVRRIVREELKTVPVSEVSTMDDLVDASIVLERVIATLSSLFGGLGAGLAALGLYGLLAYTVTRRTNEIAIRMTLGATTSDISRMVFRGALGLVGAGVVIGVPLALLSRRAAARVVTDLSGDNVWPAVLATTAMLAIAFAAAYGPACRAMRVKPVEALRQ